MNAATLALFTTLDLSIGEQATALDTRVKLVEVIEKRDPIHQGVRDAQVRLEIDGKPAALHCGNYELPVALGKVQADCTVTTGYYSNSTANHWGLKKDARIRIWPKGSPWMKPGKFTYPLKQRWFVTQTQMSNEPTYVDRGESGARKKVYYHAGLDSGGVEGLTEIIAATDAQIVSLGEAVLPPHDKDTPVAKRYDVIYLLDERGWYYRYSHLFSFDDKLKLGDRVSMGQRLGLLGKEGGSGGWSHLHFEIVSRQPSGEWGTNDGYAFLWEAYRNQYKPAVTAIARPHRFALVNEPVSLDASRSQGKIETYEWLGRDRGKILEVRYAKPGTYSEVLKVAGAAGHVSYDIATVNVLDPAHRDQDPPTIHVSYHPSLDLKPTQAITFKVRTFGTTQGEEFWDFGDGTTATTKSDGNVKMHAKDGYAVIEHRYARPGDFIVKVRRANAVTHVWVPVR